MSVRSKETIFDAALLRTGNAKASDSSSLREAMDANYDEIVRAAFEDSDGNLPFGRARVTLTSRFDGTSGFEDAFTLPDECIHVFEAYLDEYSCSNLLQPWEINGVDHSLLIDAGTRAVSVDIVKLGQEAKWSASFALGVQRRLEAVIKDVLEETEEAAYKEAEGDAAFLRAGVKASKGRSASPLFKKRTGRLHRARRSRD